MAGETTSYTLGELVDLSQGLAINAKTSYLIGDFGTPLLRITDLINDTRCQFVDVTKVPQQCVVTPDELIYTRTGQVGLVFKGKRGVAHNNCFKVMPKPELLDSEYLYWFLSQESVRTHANAIASGSVQKDLNHRAFKSIPIEIPCLQIQRAVSAILNSIQDKIELNRRMNATLEAMARALFQSWFVDFAPVRAKLDGRKPTGIDPDIAALFPEHLEDSPLGQIPHGWEVSRLDEIALVVMGLSPDGESYNAEGLGIPLINGPVEFGDYFPVKTKWTEAATRFASESDLIFCVRGSTTGRRVVSDGEYGIGRGVCAIRAKGGCHSFLYQTINHGLNRLLEKTTGSVFPSLSAPDIKGFSVLKPSMAILEAYERATKPLIQRIQQNHHQSRTLATLRDTLLPKLLSGELSVAGGSSSELLSGANPRDAQP